MSAGLDVASGFKLPLDAVTETFAILAVKRAGKSNAAVVIAEQMYDAGIPWVAIDPKGDWWGVRAAGDGEAPGLSVLVFGGLHGDVPLEPTAGKLVADLIVEHRLTCVLDVSEMTKADQRRFLVDFADRLYRTNREPLHVFCEEADEYIPQRVMGDQAKLVGAFETLVKRGGFRGIGVTLITQRSASLNKDVLTQAGTLIAMRTPSPQDRKAVLAWIDHHAASSEVIDELPTLQAGEAWVFSPQWLGVLKKIRFHRRRTFDSGATPKFGEKPRPAATLADVDVDAITTAMADTIEKTKAADPKVMQATIVRLERELAAERAKPAPEVEVTTVEVPVVRDATLGHLQDALEDLREIVNELALAIAPTRVVAPSVEQRAVPKRLAPAARVAPPRPTPTVSVDDGTVPPARRKLLTALVALESIGVDVAPRNQVALFAGVSPKSSGYSNNLGAMNTSGLITYPGRGLVMITDAGRAHVDEIPEVVTSQELHQRVQELVSPSRWRILEPLIAAYPEPVERAQLAELAGVSAGSSGYSNNLGALRSLGLLDYPDRGLVVAGDVLFLGGAR